MENILYFTRTMGLGGTEKVILQLCDIMKPEFNKIIVCSCGGVNVEKLNRMNIKHYEIPDIEKKDFKTIITVLKIITKIIKNENINIVHTHHRMAAFYMRIIGFTRKFIFIHNVHNTFTDKKKLTKFALNKAHIVAVGNKVKQNINDYYGISGLETVVINNAVESFDSQVQAINILKKCNNEGYFLIGNVGRLSEQKGMEYFIKAVPMILNEVSKIKFFIIGDGEDKEKLQKLISSLHLENNIIMLGYRNDIQNVMRQLDLIVLSSLWEGFPLTPIEAFSVGKTVIATAVDGTVEIVDDSINGKLIEPKDSRDIADKVLDLYKSPNRIKLYEENAYKKYKENFSYEILQIRYKEYYRNIIKKYT